MKPAIRAHRPANPKAAAARVRDSASMRPSSAAPTLPRICRRCSECGNHVKRQAVTTAGNNNNISQTDRVKKMPLTAGNRQNQQQPGHRQHSAKDGQVAGPPSVEASRQRAGLAQLRQGKDKAWPIGSIPTGFLKSSMAAARSR